MNDRLNPIAPHERSIASRFADVARSVPNQVAVSAPGVEWTYAEALDVAERTVNALVDGGTEPGDRVAVLFKQEPAAFAALMGSMASGAMAVPILPDHPIERLRQILTDAAPRIIVTLSTNASVAEAIAPSGTSIVAVDRLPASAARPWRDGPSDRPAVVMYTSGSTGAAKGVVISHRQLLQKMALNARIFDTTVRDRFALFGTCAVGQGMTAILSALLHGAALCPFDVRSAGGGKLVDWLVRDEISVYMSTLTLFRHLIQNIDSGHRFERVRLVRLGGERVTASDVQAHRRCFASSRLLVSYSSTETGPITVRIAGPDDETADTFVPVGTPVEGVTVRIVDETGQPVADGQPGQLVVRSPFLSDGYWRDTERTARMFQTVEDESHVREFRTGDIGRLESGILHYLGRHESRVKIRGFRVEIDEVELRLRECLGVVRAAVTTTVQPDGALGLVGYVQLAQGAQVTATGLRHALAVRLPEYAVPAAFVALDVLPLTDSGKPDRQRLPAPTPDRLMLDATGARPRNPVEGAIADVWREVLGIDVSVFDDFVSIGGDSLKAGRVATRLSRVFDVDVPVGELLEASTVERSAQLIERLRGRKT